MKKILFFACALFCFNVAAQTEVAPTPTTTISNAGEVEYKKAILNIVNKKKGQFKNIEIIVGSENSFENVFIKLNSCKMRKTAIPNDFWAFINFKNQDILFEQDDTFSEEVIRNKNINLWLSSAYPSISGIEDETYDITLIRCEN